ncbi:hypothetical protein Lal_00020709 [Lupinus albus]|nr:hypothetical protein Lal_00020709 [Lupinus albus]
MNSTSNRIVMPAKELTQQTQTYPGVTRCQCYCVHLGQEMERKRRDKKTVKQYDMCKPGNKSFRSISLPHQQTIRQLLQVYSLIRSTSLYLLFIFYTVSLSLTWYHAMATTTNTGTDSSPLLSPSVVTPLQAVSTPLVLLLPSIKLTENNYLINLNLLHMVLETLVTIEVATLVIVVDVVVVNVVDVRLAGILPCSVFTVTAMAMTSAHAIMHLLILGVHYHTPGTWLSHASNTC